MSLAIPSPSALHAADRPVAAACDATLLAGAAQALTALSGLTLPLPALQRIQADYLEEAAALWKRSLEPAAPDAVEPLADRRFGKAWSEHAHSAFLARL